MPRDAFPFRSGWSISQQWEDFTADGHFGSPFHSCKMRLEGCEMALVCKGWFRSCETTCEMGVQLRKWEFLGVEDFAKHFAVAKWGEVYEMALVCQRGVSQLRKFSQRWEWGYEIISQSMGVFAAGPWGCEIISQPRAIFAGALFSLRNFADHGFFRLLSSSWFPTTFL